VVYVQRKGFVMNKSMGHSPLEELGVELVKQPVISLVGANITDIGNGELSNIFNDHLPNGTSLMESPRRSGIQNFFTRTLVRSWNIFNDIKWKREQTLPTILSLEEVSDSGVQGVLRTTLKSLDNHLCGSFIS